MCLVSKANTVGNVLGQADTQAAEELEGKPFAVMVREAEWKDTMVESNVDQMVNEPENANKKMNAIEESALIGNLVQIF